MKKTLLCLLAICMIIGLGSCKNRGAGEEETTAIEVSPAKIISLGWLSEADFANDKTVADWYEDASSRTIVKNAVLFALGEDGLWHCRLYLGDWTEGDGLTFGAETSAGYCVVISHAAQSTGGETNADKIFAFTVESDEPPRFDLYVNREEEGLIATHSDEPIGEASEDEEAE